MRTSIFRALLVSIALIVPTLVFAQGVEGTNTSVVIALIGAGSTVALSVIGILGTVINNKLNRAEQDSRDARVAALAAVKESSSKIDHLTVLSNSNLSATNLRLDEAMAQIKALTERLTSSMEKARAEMMEEMRAPTTMPIAQAVAEVTEALKEPK